MIDNIVRSALLGSVIGFALCAGPVGSGANRGYVKEHAAETWKNAGWSVVGPAGFQYGSGLPFTTYGGAKVWYYVKRENSDMLYQGYLVRWGDELHIYGPEPVDKYSVGL